MPSAGRKASPPKPGKGKDVLVSLSADLTLALTAFCEAHYGASQTRVLCEALTEFIARRLESEPQMRLRYNDARDRLMRPVADVVRLQDAPTRVDKSSIG